MMTDYISTSSEQEIKFLQSLLKDSKQNINNSRKSGDLNVIGVVSTFKPFLERYKRNQLIHTNIDICYTHLGKYKDIIFDLNKYEVYLLENDIGAIDLSTFFKYIYKLEDILESLQLGEKKDGANNIDVQDIINKAEYRLLNIIFKYYLSMVKSFNPLVSIQNGDIFPSILDDQECMENLQQIIEFYSNQDKLTELIRFYINERQNFIKNCLSYVSFSKIKKDNDLKLAFESMSSFISIENFLVKDLKFGVFLGVEEEQDHSSGLITSYAIFQQIISFMCAKVLSKIKTETTNENSSLNKFVITNSLTNMTDILTGLDKEYNTKTVIVEQFVKQEAILNQTCQILLENILSNAKTTINKKITKLPSDFGINSYSIEIFSKLKQSLDNYRTDVIQFMAHKQIELKSWLPRNEQGVDIKEFKNVDINLSSSKMKYQIYILDFIVIVFANLESKSSTILGSGVRSDYSQYFNQNYQELNNDVTSANNQNLSQAIPKDEVSTISGIFLLTHLKILQQLLNDQKSENNELIELKLAKLEKKYSEMILTPWKKVIQPMMPLINNSSMKTNDQNFKKNKEVAKEKFLRFNSNFDKLLSNWTLNLKPLIKDKNLKKKLKKEIKMLIEPMYKLLYDKYSTNWFKNKEKYVRFDSRELSRKLDSL